MDSRPNLVEFEFASRSEAFRALATRLSDRLAQFEERLAGRPGQVRATIYFSSSERPKHQLNWCRMDGQWQLYVYDVPTEQEREEHYDDEHGFPDGINGRPLSSASIDVKIGAVKALPELLTEIKLVEARKLHSLREAHEVLDTLAGGIDGEEGP